MLILIGVDPKEDISSDGLEYLMANAVPGMPLYTISFSPFNSFVEVNSEIMGHLPVEERGT